MPMGLGTGTWPQEGSKLARAGWQHSDAKPARERVVLRESVRGSTFVLGRTAATVEAQLGTGWSCSPVPGRSSLVHSSRQHWRLGAGCCPGGALLPHTWAVVAKSPQACRSSQVTIWLGCVATMPRPVPSAASSKSSWVVVSPSEPLSWGSHHLKPLTRGDCSELQATSLWCCPVTSGLGHATLMEDGYQVLCPWLLASPFRKNSKWPCWGRLVILLLS